MKKRIDYSRINEYLVHIREKTTGKNSTCKEWCHGNLHQHVFIWVHEMAKMCYLGVSNKTHEVVYIENVGTGEIVYDTRK